MDSESVTDIHQHYEVGKDSGLTVQLDKDMMYHVEYIRRGPKWKNSLIHAYTLRVENKFVLLREIFERSKTKIKNILSLNKKAEDDMPRLTRSIPTSCTSCCKDCNCSNDQKTKTHCQICSKIMCREHTIPICGNYYQVKCISFSRNIKNCTLYVFIFHRVFASQLLFKIVL